MGKMLKRAAAALLAYKLYKVAFPAKVRTVSGKLVLVTVRFVVKGQVLV